MLLRGEPRRVQDAACGLGVSAADLHLREQRQPVRHPGARSLRAQPTDRLLDCGDAPLVAGRPAGEDGGPLAVVGELVASAELVQLLRRCGQ